MRAMMCITAKAAANLKFVYVRFQDMLWYLPLNMSLRDCLLRIYNTSKNRLKSLRDCLTRSKKVVPDSSGFFRPAPDTNLCTKQQTRGTQTVWPVMPSRVYAEQDLKKKETYVRKIITYKDLCTIYWGVVGLFFL